MRLDFVEQVGVRDWTGQVALFVLCFLSIFTDFQISHLIVVYSFTTTLAIRGLSDMSSYTRSTYYRSWLSSAQTSPNY